MQWEQLLKPGLGKESQKSQNGATFLWHRTGGKLHWALDSPVTRGAGDSAMHTGTLDEGVHTLQAPWLHLPKLLSVHLSVHPGLEDTSFYFSPILTHHHIFLS